MAWDSEDKKELKKLFKTFIDNIENMQHFAIVFIDKQGNLQTANASDEDGSGLELVGGIESLKHKLLMEYHSDEGEMDLDLED